MSPPRLAVVHTVVGLAEMFRGLIAKRYPTLDAYHVVDESLLQDLLRQGSWSGVTRRVAKHAMLAQDAGATVILFTCSSTSPAVDVARHVVDIPVVKVDQAMAERAVEFARIGVVCTTHSTQGPTEALLKECAAARGETLEIETSLSSVAYEARLRGDQALHDRLVTEAAMALAPRHDVIVLAQASLAHLGPKLAEMTGKQCLASPELGVESLRRWVAPT